MKISERLAVYGLLIVACVCGVRLHTHAYRAELARQHSPAKSEEQHARLPAPPIAAEASTSGTIAGTLPAAPVSILKSGWSE